MTSALVLPRAHPDDPNRLLVAACRACRAALLDLLYRRLAPWRAGQNAHACGRLWSIGGGWRGERGFLTGVGAADRTPRMQAGARPFSAGPPAQPTAVDAGHRRHKLGFSILPSAHTSDPAWLDAGRGRWAVTTCRGSTGRSRSRSAGRPSTPRDV